MVARYMVLEKPAKKLILLCPYQIHAIEAMREASKIGKSGFIWHTTGSGKQGHYFNVLEEIKEGKPDKEADSAESVQIDSDYELMAYSSTKIDYEYIINLIQNIAAPDDGGVQENAG